MKKLIQIVVIVASTGCGYALAEDPQPPELPFEHVHPSGVFTFRTPQDWKVAVSADDHQRLRLEIVVGSGECGAALAIAPDKERTHG